MIKVTGSNGGPLNLNVTVAGIAIYLDNFSIIRLAKDDANRRKRFIDVVRSGRADLLFSVSNAAEIVGPQGGSLEAVRRFLDDVGPHWFPVELDAYEVVNRELAGMSVADTCVCKDFVRDYAVVRLGQYSGDAGRIIDLSESFFRLGAVLDWLCPQRQSILGGSASLDAALVSRIDGYRRAYDQEPVWLNQKFPSLKFHPARPALFTYVNLIRGLIVEAKAFRLKKGDGLDFCHAVMASAFATVATLDGQWKRRIESLPKPNRLARIYYAPELDQMVTELEKMAGQVRNVTALSAPGVR